MLLIAKCDWLSRLASFVGRLILTLGVGMGVVLLLRCLIFNMTKNYIKNILFFITSFEVFHVKPGKTFNLIFHVSRNFLNLDGGHLV